jgi:hypothetical protein
MPKYYITLQQRKQTNRRTSNRKYGKRRTVKFPHPVAESLMPRFYEPPAAAQSGGAWNMFGQHYAPIAPSNDSYETYKGSESSYMPNSIPNSTPNSIPNSMPSSMPSSSAMSSISTPNWIMDQSSTKKFSYKNPTHTSTIQSMKIIIQSLVGKRFLAGNSDSISTNRITPTTNMVSAVLT